MSALDLGKKYVEIINYASSYSQAWLRKPTGYGEALLNVSAIRAVRDLDENTSKSYFENFLVDKAGSQWIQTSTNFLSTNPRAALVDLSKSGRYNVAFYNNGVGTAGAKKESGSFIEIIDQQSGSSRIDTSTYHGRIIGDSWFGGGCSWSSDERFVAYVAQVAGSSGSSPTRKTVIEKLLPSKLDDKASEGKESPNKFDYIEDWGEKYVDVSDLGIFVLDIQERKVIAIIQDESEYTIGQPVFVPHPSTPSKYAIAYTAWNVKPRRLGMIYCYQRKASVWIADVTTALTTDTNDSTNNSLPHWKLSNGIEIARSPRASPSGKQLIFLGNRKGFTSHNGCSELFKVDLTSFWLNPDNLVEPATVIAEVRRSNDNALDFPGLFLDSLPKSCFLSEDEIAFTSLWESRDSLLRFSLSNAADGVKNVVWWKNLATEWKDSSIQILDIHRETGYLLAQISNPVLPYQLLLFNLNDNDSNVLVGPAPKSFAITTKHLPEREASLYNPHIYWQIFRHETDGIRFNSILIHPKKENNTASLPLVVVPHGGPHACLSNSFIGSYVFLVESLGVAVLFVNYRGSTGFGQDSIESLLGKIGTNDVADIITSLNHALSLNWNDNADVSLIDANRVGIVGGSHGGFLAAHMSGQYPDIFKACALRNPVTNIPTMASVTDIPDWCHVEAQTGSLDVTRGAITDEELIAMRKVSPVAYIHQYQTPTLICLGAKDRRVPASQGIEFYHLLQGRGVPSR